MSKHETINLADFNPSGRLGQMFARAKAINQLNDQLVEFLPEIFKPLSLCMVEGHTATFVTNNQALAFRAQKQQDELLSVLRRIDALSHIKKILIKVDLQE